MKRNGYNRSKIGRTAVNGGEVNSLALRVNIVTLEVNFNKVCIQNRLATVRLSDIIRKTYSPQQTFGQAKDITKDLDCFGVL